MNFFFVSILTHHPNVNSCLYNQTGSKTYCRSLNRLKSSFYLLSNIKFWLFLPSPSVPIYYFAKFYTNCNIYHLKCARKFVRRTFNAAFLHRCVKNVKLGLKLDWLIDRNGRYLSTVNLTKKGISLYSLHSLKVKFH